MFSGRVVPPGKTKAGQQRKDSDPLRPELADVSPQQADTDQQREN